MVATMIFILLEIQLFKIFSLLLLLIIIYINLITYFLLNYDKQQRLY